MEKLRDIQNYYKWDKIEAIRKGWSEEEKYYIEDRNGRKFLLRLSEISQKERREREYLNLKKLENLEINTQRPLEFGICNKGDSVYTLLTWIEGEDAHQVLPRLTLQHQRRLGATAGAYLREMHRVSAPSNLEGWSTRYERKIKRNIENYKKAVESYPQENDFIQFIDENIHLVKNRPQTFQHGDYHVGSMVITPEGTLGIIDFNRQDYGDPWEEFNRLPFCVSISSFFTSAMIEEYIGKQPGEKFFRLITLYVISNQLGALQWAIPFGDDEVQMMMKQAQEIYDWYHGFKRIVPKWFQPK